MPPRAEGPQVIREVFGAVRAEPRAAIIVASAIAIATAVGFTSRAWFAPMWAVVAAVAVTYRRMPNHVLTRASIEVPAPWWAIKRERLDRWSAATLRSLAVAGGGAIMGVAAGLALAMQPNADELPPEPPMVVFLGTVLVTSLLPGTHARSRPDGAEVATGSLAALTAFAAMCLYGAFSIAGGIKTNFQLAIMGVLGVPTLIFGMAATVSLILRVLERGRVHPAMRLPATTRFFVVAALVVTTVAGVLGASVQARPGRRDASDRIAALPELPDNVAFVLLDTGRGRDVADALARLGEPGASTKVATADAAVERARRFDVGRAVAPTIVESIPGATVVGVRTLVRPEGHGAFSCLLGCLGTFVVGSPQLTAFLGHARYGDVARPDDCVGAAWVCVDRSARRFTPTADEYVNGILRHDRLPVFAPSQLNLKTVAAAVVTEQKLATAQHGVLVTTPEPWTERELADLRRGHAISAGPEELHPSVVRTERPT